MKDKTLLKETIVQIARLQSLVIIHNNKIASLEEDIAVIENGMGVIVDRSFKHKKKIEKKMKKMAKRFKK